MKLTELIEGEAIFIDANIFVYHFAGHSLQCKTLLERCARRELLGYTSTAVLAEVLHRLMIAEAIEQGLVPAKNAVRKLKERPQVIRQLSVHSDAVQHIGQMNLRILSLTWDILVGSKAIRQQEGLLTNDSLVVSAMQAMRL